VPPVLPRGEGCRPGVVVVAGLAGRRLAGQEAGAESFDCGFHFFHRVPGERTAATGTGTGRASGGQRGHARRKRV
jgi:hypothetical protein